MNTILRGLLTLAFLMPGCAGKTGSGQPGQPVLRNDTPEAVTLPDTAALMQPQLAVGLADGTKLMGRLTRRLLTIQTSYMKSDVPIELLASMERESQGGPFTINFSNGDRIRGTVSFDSLEMETLLGHVSIPIDKVTSISFLHDVSGPTGGLAASYPLKGNADDVSGHNYNGVPHGVALTSDRHGLPNSACLFNGTGSYVQIPDVMFTPSVRGFTICAWVLARETGSRGMAVYTGTRMGESMLQVDHGSFEFLSKLVDGNWYMASAPAVRGKYVCLAGVYRRGKSLQLWINGERMSESPIPDLDLYGGPPAASASIGAYWPENLSLAWGGAIDNVRIYSRALNESEVQSLYAAEK